MRLRLLVAGLSIAMLCASGVAGAAQRYASPAGSGTACTQGTPCTLQQAITAAGANDEVIVGAGNYPVAATIPAPPVMNLYIHGDLGGPMPHIEATTSAAPISFGGTGGRLSYLDIANTKTSAWGSACPYGGRVDRLRVRVSGGGSVGVYAFGDCTVTDSVLVANGEYAMGLVATSISSSMTVVARNLTALATGKESVGISATYNGIVPGSVSIDLKNSIASGAKADLYASGSFGTGSIAVTHSNFDLATAVPTGGTITGSSNQTAPPLFVNAAAGDYREAVGSPTIDAGSTDGIGSTDLAGNPRNLGAAPDIGAYEFVPPETPPPPPGSLQALALKPKTFRTLNAGGAIFSKQSAPVGTKVSYTLSAPATVSFEVERALPGRKVGKKCKKPAAANRDRKKCTRFKAQKPPFSHAGVAGQNSFKFSGRVGGKALRPGRYRLVARANGTVKRGAFRVVR